MVRGVDPQTTPGVLLRANVENELHVIRANLNVKLY
jgi:hypothetical protein